MKTIEFPAVVTQVANLPQNPLQAEGTTLLDVMRHLCHKHDALRNHLFYENNDRLKQHFLFTSNGELIEPDEHLPEVCSIEVILAASGGHDSPSLLTREEIQRYVRHVTLPGVGRAGQQRLKNAKVLVVGTGGLGSPASLYLAAAGVGTIGLIDFDVVEVSNLQRQIIHGTSTLGKPKVESAKMRLLDMNPLINIKTYATIFDAVAAEELVPQYDLVVDGTDNFSTRYLVNHACARHKKPLVHGSIYRFDGQVSVFNHGDGPCYQCLYPNSPPADLSPSCSAGGVIGVLPGVVGLLQATEAIKLIVELGEPLVGRLLRFDALTMCFNEVRFRRKANCPTCGADHAASAPPEEEAFCDTVGSQAMNSDALSEDRYVDPLTLKNLLDGGINDNGVLLDVRESNELEVCSLPNVVHIPLGQLSQRLAELDKSKPHYVICYGGVRAERAANTMLAAGFRDPKVLRGGMKRWVRDVDPSMPIY